MVVQMLPSIGRTELLILTALAGSGDLYGTEVVRRLCQLTDGKVNLSLGGLYTTLHRMEHKGIISGRWGETTPDREGARRRYYRITGLGQRVLAGDQEILTRAWGLRPQRARA